MSYLIERWTQELGKDSAEEALRRFPDVAQMPWQQQEVILRSLERLHENTNTPVTLENSERLYRSAFHEEPAKAEPAFKVKSADVEADFFQNATTEEIGKYLQAKHGAR